MNWKDMPKLPLVLIAVMFVAGAVLYPSLPQVIPTHWGPSGAADAWSQKSFMSVFMLPLISLGLYALFIVMPLFVPAANALGINMVWFAVVMAVNLQTAFISPPVGFSLFYLQSVAPKEVRTIEIHRGAIPFMILQVVILILVMLFPQTVIGPIRFLESL